MNTHCKIDSFDLFVFILNSGYMAPEYAMEGLFSIKSDVFSFGVLLLEIISGKKNGGFYLSEHGQSLLIYVCFLTTAPSKCYIYIYIYIFVKLNL